MFAFEPIGIARTARTDPSDTPVQAGVNLDDTYHDALDGLDGFSHAWLLTPLGGPGHAAAAVELHQRPFLRPEGPPMGIFTTRGPRRPNPIGLSLVEIVAVSGTEVRFRGVDIVDRTPLLDLKPYFADVDEPRSEVHRFRDTRKPARPQVAPVVVPLEEATRRGEIANDGQGSRQPGPRRVAGHGWPRHPPLVTSLLSRICQGHSRDRSVPL